MLYAVLYSYLPYIRTVLEELAQTHKAQVQLEARRRVSGSSSSAAAPTRAASHTGPKLPIIQGLEVDMKRSIYGYFPNEVPFIKVYLHNPASVRLIVHILENGLLGGVIMQPYEAHIPYLLQFTTDYNVSPMGWIHFNSALIRPTSSSRHARNSNSSSSVSSAHDKTAPLKPSNGDSEGAATGEVDVGLFLSPMHTPRESVCSVSGGGSSGAHQSQQQPSTPSRHQVFADMHSAEVQEMERGLARSHPSTAAAVTATTEDILDVNPLNVDGTNTRGVLMESCLDQNESCGAPPAAAPAAATEGELGSHGEIDDGTFLHALLEGISRSQSQWSQSGPDREAADGAADPLMATETEMDAGVPLSLSTSVATVAGVGSATVCEVAAAPEGASDKEDEAPVSYHEQWKELLRRRVSAHPNPTTEPIVRRAPVPVPVPIPVPGGGAPDHLPTTVDLGAEVDMNGEEDTEGVYQPRLAGTVDVADNEFTSVSDKWARFPLLLKSSGCEVEIDIFASDIENIYHAHTEFGAELLARPEFQHQAFQDILTKASTASAGRGELPETAAAGGARVMHLPGRAESLAQVDFRGRAARLINKGRLLMEVEEESSPSSDDGGDDVEYYLDEGGSGTTGQYRRTLFDASGLSGISVGGHSGPLFGFDESILNASGSQQNTVLVQASPLPPSQTSTLVDSEIDQNGSMSQSFGSPMQQSPSLMGTVNPLEEWARAAARLPSFRRQSQKSQRQLQLQTQPQPQHRRMRSQKMSRKSQLSSQIHNDLNASDWFCTQLSQQRLALTPAVKGAVGAPGSEDIDVPDASRLAEQTVDDDAAYSEYMSVFKRPRDRVAKTDQSPTAAALGMATRTIIAPLPLPLPDKQAHREHMDDDDHDDGDGENDEIGLSAERESQGILSFGYTQEYLESVGPVLKENVAELKEKVDAGAALSYGGDTTNPRATGTVPAHAHHSLSLQTENSSASEAWSQAGREATQPSLLHKKDSSLQSQSQRRVSFTDEDRGMLETTGQSQSRKRLHAHIATTSSTSSNSGVLSLASLFSKKHRGASQQVRLQQPPKLPRRTRPPPVHLAASQCGSSSIAEAETTDSAALSGVDQEGGLAVSCVDGDMLICPIRLQPSHAPPPPALFSLAHLGDIRLQSTPTNSSGLLFVPSVIDTDSSGPLTESVPSGGDEADEMGAQVAAAMGVEGVANLSMDSQEEATLGPQPDNEAGVAVVHEQYASGSRGSTDGSLGALYGEIFYGDMTDVTPSYGSAAAANAAAAGAGLSKRQQPALGVLTVYAGRPYHTRHAHALVPEFNPTGNHGAVRGSLTEYRFALQRAVYNCLIPYYRAQALALAATGSDSSNSNSNSDQGVLSWSAMVIRVQECYYFLRHQMLLGLINRLYTPIAPSSGRPQGPVWEYLHTLRRAFEPGVEAPRLQEDEEKVDGGDDDVIFVAPGGTRTNNTLSVCHNYSSGCTMASVRAAASDGITDACGPVRLVLAPTFSPPNPREAWKAVLRVTSDDTPEADNGPGEISSGADYSGSGDGLLDPEHVLSDIDMRRNLNWDSDPQHHHNQLFSNVITSPIRTGQVAAAGPVRQMRALGVENANTRRASRAGDQSSRHPAGKALGMKLNPAENAGNIVDGLGTKLPRLPVLLDESFNSVSMPVSASASGDISGVEPVAVRNEATNEAAGPLTARAAPSGNLSRKVLLSVEIFCPSRSTTALSTAHGATSTGTSSGGAGGTSTVFLTPTPKLDPIRALFYVIDDSVGNEETNTEVSRKHYGMITVDANKRPPGPPSAERGTDGEAFRRNRLQACGIPAKTRHHVASDEKSLLLLFVDVVRRSDPDMIAGYEVQKSSLGYIIERGTERFGLKMVQLLSRMPVERESFMNTEGVDIYGGEHMSNIHITGRTVLNVWRNMKEELKLYSYSIQSVAAALLERRLPHFSAGQLTKWDTNPKFHHRVYFYIYTMAQTNLLLLDKLDIIRRTSESARLYGIDFYSVLVRGSQYRVEAVLVKKAHKQGYICPSPSKGKVARQSAMSVIPLVMEPNPSGFYSDPVVVLDFASLYPSMIIAYNLCYSTIMGKLKIGTVSANDTSAAGGDAEPLVQDTTGRLGTENYPEAYSAMGAYYNTLDLNLETHRSASANETKSGTFSSSGVSTDMATSDASPNFSPDPANPFTEPTSHHNPSTSTSTSSASAATSTSVTEDGANGPARRHAPFLAPNGSLFCNKDVRKGVLPAMLEEILQARVTVKTAMKYYKSRAVGSEGDEKGTGNDNGNEGSDVLGRVLDARQLAIKLLANVTYGYTAAGYSGRMPMAELADAVVQCGRTTLEWTMKVIQDGLAETEMGTQTDANGESNNGITGNRKKKYFGWSNARVVYGDTDSVFVHLPGRTKEEAFRIGAEISRYIGEASPANVTLKLEKVYMGCVMVTKKRYVGNSFETVDQVDPHFDAKGLECIRRDQCQATAKIQEKCLRMLFKTRGDLSQIKDYLCKEWYRIESGVNNISLQDFIFCKAVKLGHYSSPSSYPPGATVALKNMIIDPYSYPVYKWRVPYVVVYGHSGTGANAAKLKDLVLSPQDLLRRDSTTVLALNSRYYIYKCINPALIRVFNICGADINSWYINMSPHAVIKQRRAVAYDDPAAAIGLNTTALKGAAAGNTNAGKQPSQLVQSSILRYSARYACDVCGQTATPNIGLHARGTLCPMCKYTNPPAMSHNAIISRLNALRRTDSTLKRVCQNCVHHTSPQTVEYFRKGELLGSSCCESIDCPVFFKRLATVIRIEDIEYCLD